MTNLLEIKDRLIRFYSKYETYLFPVVKFIVAIVLFTVINMNIGFMEKISRFPIALILALVCAILPVNATIWLAAFVVLADMYALSEVAVTTLVLFAALFFLYFRFAPKDGFAAVLTPVCFKLNIPYVMPIGCSLLRDAYSVVAIICGTVIYYFLDGIHQNSGTLKNVVADGETAATTSKFDISVGQLLSNKEMYLVIAIFTITAIVVYLVRRLEVEHAWTLAIISGVLIEVVGLFAGYLVLNVSGKTLGLLIGNILSLLISFVIQFLFMNLDYARTERVQFEDDDYYYYVKQCRRRWLRSRK